MSLFPLILLVFALIGALFGFTGMVPNAIILGRLVFTVFSVAFIVCLFRGKTAAGFLKKLFWAFTILMAGFGCQPKQGVLPEPGLPDRDPALAYRLVQEGALLLDVRTAEEYQERNLKGSHLIPVQELAGRMREVEELTAGDKAKPIVVYCRSGKRAAQAKELLLQNGFTRVTNMGGIDDWPGKE